MRLTVGLNSSKYVVYPGVMGMICIVQPPSCKASFQTEFGNEATVASSALPLSESPANLFPVLGLFEVLFSVTC